MQIDLNGHIRIRSSDSMLVMLLIRQLKIDSMTPSINRIKGPHTSLEFFYIIIDLEI